MTRTTLLRVIFGVALLGSLALELLGEGYAPERPWDYPLFFAVTGVVGCILLSVVAKGIVSPVLDRPEDFYDTDAEEFDELEAAFAAEAEDQAAPGNPAAGGR